MIATPEPVPAGPETEIALTFRSRVRRGDPAAVRALAEATGFFNAEETDIAEELVSERLEKGPASGYEFIFAEQEGQVVGYACYGPIPGTRASYDLYWIVVHPRLQGKRVGRALLAQAEQAIGVGGGRRIYIETSSRAQYDGTRGFYDRTGYRQEALLADFYAPGDGKVIYVKALPGV